MDQMQQSLYLFHETINGEMKFKEATGGESPRSINLLPDMNINKKQVKLIDPDKNMTQLRRFDALKAEACRAHEKEKEKMESNANMIHHRLPSPIKTSRLFGNMRRTRNVIIRLSKC